MDDIGERFIELQVMAEARRCSKAALRCMSEWLGNWYEARGMTVDQGARLVKVDGYRALFYAAEQSF